MQNKKRTLRMVLLLRNTLAVIAVVLAVAVAVTGWRLLFAGSGQPEQDTISDAVTEEQDSTFTTPHTEDSSPDVAPEEDNTPDTVPEDSTAPDTAPEDSTTPDTAPENTTPFQPSDFSGEGTNPEDSNPQEFFPMEPEDTSPDSGAFTGTGEADGDSSLPSTGKPAKPSAEGGSYL